MGRRRGCTQIVISLTSRARVSPSSDRPTTSKGKPSELFAAPAWTSNRPVEMADERRMEPAATRSSSVHFSWPSPAARRMALRRPHSVSAAFTLERSRAFLRGDGASASATW